MGTATQKRPNVVSIKRILDLKSYLIAQNIKVVVCDRDIFVELVSDWAARQELT